MPFHWYTGAGAASGIGPIAEIGPGGAHAGRIVGLVPALHFAGDILGPVAGAAIAARESRESRDFNDTEAPPIDGTSRGNPVTWRPDGEPPPRGGPPPPRGGRPPEGAPPAAGSEQALEDAYMSAHAKRMGRENREYYHRVMGTPKHRPQEEQPFGPEDEASFPPHHIDTSDLRRRSP